jgi:hypothetical protein
MLGTKSSEEFVQLEDGTSKFDGSGLGQNWA